MVGRTSIEWGIEDRMRKYSMGQMILENSPTRSAFGLANFTFLWRWCLYASAFACVVLLCIVLDQLGQIKVENKRLKRIYPVFKETQLWLYTSAM